MLRQSPELVDPDASPPDERFTRLYGLISVVVAPATGVTSLLYYFGWKRTQYFWLEFGINERLLSYNSQDFLLRSVDALFNPAAFVLLAALAVRSVQRPVAAWIAGSGRVGIVKGGLLVVGAGLILGTVFGPWWNLVDENAVQTPIVGGIGLLLVAFSRAIPSPIAGVGRRPSS